MIRSLIFLIVIIGIAVSAYKAGYNAGSSEILAETCDVDCQARVETLLDLIKLSDPVPGEYLENSAEGYYE
jgi:hypothetical protein